MVFICLQNVHINAFWRNYIIFWPQAPVYQACCCRGNTCLLTLWIQRLPQSVRTTASLCGFLMGFSVTGTGFSVSTSVFFWQYHSTSAPYSFMYHRRCKIWAVTREIDCPIKKKSNKMKQCIKILFFYIYMKLNMFQATRRPSSGA